MRHSEGQVGMQAEVLAFKSNDALEIVLIMLFKELDYNNVFAREHWLCAVASTEHPDLR